MTEARLEATAALYFALPRNVMSPGWADPREATPVTAPVVEPSVRVGRAIAAISACVNDTFMAYKTKNPACSTQAGFDLKSKALGRPCYLLGVDAGDRDLRRVAGGRGRRRGRRGGRGDGRAVLVQLGRTPRR